MSHRPGCPKNSNLYAHCTCAEIDLQENTAALNRYSEAIAAANDNPQMETLRANLEDARGDRDRWRDIAKNLHRVICEAAGYTHDEIDWMRDQASLANCVADMREDKVRIDTVQVYGLTVQYNERVQLFTVQARGQVVGKLAAGSSVRLAIDGARADGGKGATT